MAKFYRPKLNSWVTTLVLASIGLHGLVLALPMPNLEEPTVEEPELVDPEVIQVVTLPKLATSPESAKPPIPEPPELVPEVLPEVPAEDLIVATPELLEELEPELEDSEWEDEELLEDDLSDLDGDLEADDPIELTLDQRLASLDSYNNYDGTRVGNSVATARLGEIVAQTGIWPSPLRSLEQALPAITLSQCISDPPGESVSVMVEVGADGALTKEPELLNSAGHEVLDEKALALAQAADYGAHHPAGETKAYSFAIQIDYEACQSAVSVLPTHG